MDFHQLLYRLDLAGTFVFAISGALRGIKKDMDVFGMLALAVVTASGGGALRSVLIGDYPIAFLQVPSYLVVCALATAIVFFFREQLIKRTKAVIIFDAFGMGIFLSLGTTVALDHHLSYWAAVLLGMVTAAFGGVIRDVLCAEVPLIFRKELYATACIAGGLVYVMLFHFHAPQTVTVFASMISAIAIRLLSVKYRWSLPR